MTTHRALVTAALLTACSLSGAVPSGGVACSDDQRCPVGLRCFRSPSFPAGLCCRDEHCGGRVMPVEGGAGPVGRPADGGVDAPVAPGCDRELITACGPGSTCRPSCEPGGSANRCDPVGTGGRNDRCNRSADCGAGLACSAPTCPSTLGAGQCRQVCRTDADCGTGSVCLGARCASNDGYRVCTTACDPRPGAPASCPSGTGCMVLAGDNTDCQCPDVANRIDDGGACDEIDRCKPQLVCTSEKQGHVCRPICQVSAPATCPAGRRCVGVPGHDVYGGCSPILNVPGQTCSPTAVGSCGPGQSCRVACAGATVLSLCKPATGSKHANEICTVDTDCADGLECRSRSCPSGTPVKYCAPFCRTVADCRGSSSCDAESCNDNDVSSPFSVCSNACDPIGKTAGCPGGLICTLYPFDKTDCDCHTDGIYPGEGQPCSAAQFGNSCQEGLICVTRAGASVCRPICRLAARDCAPDRTCVELSDHRIYGACVRTAGDIPPVCDPAVAASCPGAGSACRVSCDGIRADVVCAKSGAIQPGQICLGDDDCVPGARCLNTGCEDGAGQSIQRCYAYCKSDADCGGGTAQCLRNACNDARIPFGSCTMACDPRGPKTSGCPQGLECLLYQGNFTNCSCHTPKAGGADGDPCTMVDDCLPGNTCVFELTRQTCRAICKIDDPGTCRPGRTCSPLPDQRLYGACLP
jgi:hypothetical protein